ncbi:16S rRNA pseudouridine(516) synthase RsuA [Shewanella eurypsychrophilus]|uniref:Pseudouridine synthase n=1 Tax=Shewanella eurypsychrophilus TaxID=2593656 RepID=A0ABX6VA70_9GAMM|nr:MULTISPECIES: 16S rRNA pseudouridine(516) synthase RsuA [Shewanella]QFU24052.1 16S rRNA pseudouridine(516) synthase RsuA [Shewanella sp. YLB-09]QPG59261.1 16S rRNA pseudouridine(516) synthase RsuA [Shewanella eurypsychrophilus]
MRLDKFICESTELTRSLAKKALHKGDVTCDGEVIKNSSFKVKEGQVVRLAGDIISVVGPRFLMLNKPAETICATFDEVHPTVIDLLDIEKPDDLHIAGRLDIDTTGLVLITTDGQWSHKITSPKKDCGKCYLVTLDDELDAALIDTFAQGIQLKSEDGLTKPAILEIIDSHTARLTITEGKYHQVKRMFAAVGYKVVGLHRESVGQITLDDDLEPGEWRHLTAEEVASV